MESETESETGLPQTCAFAQPNVRAMEPYVPGEQPQAGKFIKLNTNENPFPPAESVISAIQQAAKENLNLYPDPNFVAFRRVAADVLDVDPDWIICGNGSDDILTILTRTFVGSKDSLRMPNPSYSLYKTLAELQNANVDTVDFTSDWQLPDQFFETPPRVKLVYLPNPNSPSGTMIGKRELSGKLDRLGCPLVIDEAYVDFAEENCIDLVKQSDKVIVTRSLSKSYGLAGLRFGFGIAQPHVIAEMMKVKDSYNCDRLAMAGATAALNNQQWLKDTVVRIQSTRTRLSQRLTESGFVVIPSQANFVWCNHANLGSQFIYEELKSRKVLVRYMKYGQWGEGIRITVGSDEQVDALLAILETIVSQSKSG